MSQKQEAGNCWINGTLADHDASDRLYIDHFRSMAPMVTELPLEPPDSDLTR